MQDQPRMLAEIARVLTADGVLVLSAPNPVEYSTASDYRNPFHLHEPAREELDALLAPLSRRGAGIGSGATSGPRVERGSASLRFEAWEGDACERATCRVLPRRCIAVVVARNDRADAMPQASPAVSFYSDRDGDGARAAGRAGGEVLRLDQLAGIPRQGSWRRARCATSKRSLRYASG